MTDSRPTAWQTALLSVCLLASSFATARSPDGTRSTEAALAAQQALAAATKNGASLAGWSMTGRSAAIFACCRRKRVS